MPVTKLTEPFGSIGCRALKILFWSGVSVTCTWVLQHTQCNTERGEKGEEDIYIYKYALMKNKNYHAMVIVDIQRVILSSK